jgi:hypothetical protein
VANTNTAISLPPIRQQIIDVTLVGDTPMIVHSWSLKAKKEMLDKQTGAPKSGRAKKDPEQDFQDSLYKLQDGGHGFPSIAFKTAAVTAVTSVGGVTKVATRQAFHVLGEHQAAGRHARPDGQAVGRDHRNADHLELQGRPDRP